MNGYSLIFAVILILSIAVISGAVAAGLVETTQLASRPFAHRKRAKGPRVLHH